MENIFETESVDVNESCCIYVTLCYVI